RVNIVYKDLQSVLKDQTLLSFGGFMNGDNIYEMDLPKKGILVLGNEANGIQHDVESLISTRVSIPRFGDVQETESLNVANATSILLSEFRRRH
ncbi:RNA methyltransferase, partial [Flavobacteriaceae bacterium]|nr:RNA methyltransferase [Flavobacteriaceae bacterium]